MDTGYVTVENFTHSDKLPILKIFLDFYKFKGINLGLKWVKDFLDRVEVFGKEEIPYEVSYEEFLTLKLQLVGLAVISFSSLNDGDLRVIVDNVNFELSTVTIPGVNLTDKDLGKEVFMFNETGNYMLFGRVGKKGKLVSFLTFKGKNYVTVTTNGVTTSFEPLTDNFILLEENVC